MSFDLESVKLRTVTCWYSLVNTVDSFKRFLLKPVSIYNRAMRQRRVGSSVDESGDDESEDAFDEALLKPTAVQLTRLYVRRQKMLAKSEQTPEDALMYYMDSLAQNEDETSDLKFIGELLSDNVDVNYVDGMDENLLFKAVKAEDENLVKFLLKKDVNVKLVNYASLNIFHICARHKKSGILRSLADKFAENDLREYLELKTTRERHTPLHFAAKEGSLAIADCLISVYNVNKEALDYKNRTPLFVAAEFNRKSMAKLLIDLKCCISFTDHKKREMLNNVRGQTALYWIVAKMPDIATTALDGLYEPNPYLRKDKHYLAALEPRIVKKKRSGNKEPMPDDDFLPKSALSAIVETGNLDLIMHPTIASLIEVKWKTFARKEAWFDFILSLAYVAVWIAFALWSPYNKRHSYDLTSNEDRFRLALFVIGILFTVYFIVSEMREVHNDFNYQKKAIQFRQNELNEYKDDSLDEDSAEANFIRDEESVLREFSNLTVFKDYISDAWNLYDWISILLLLSCIITHIDDIVGHTEEKARLHIRLMSITVIIISLRILKSSRIVIPKLGTLVMILFYTMSDIFIWFLFHMVLWLSFAVSFWMIYGGHKFQQDVSEDAGCFNVDDTEYNEANNCTVVSVPAFEKGFGFLTYALYAITFGGNFDEASMDAIDDQMKIPLTGAYIAMTILISANIFIALLSATFQRVYDRAEANIIFERATAIINAEKSMSYVERRHHIRYLRKIGYPYIDDSYNEIITTIDDRIVSLENDVKEQKDLLKGIENTLDATGTAMGIQNVNAVSLVRQLDQDVKELKDVVLSFVNQAPRPKTPEAAAVESDESFFEKAPQFEYLKFDSAPSPH